MKEQVREVVGRLNNIDGIQFLMLADSVWRRTSDEDGNPVIEEVVADINEAEDIQVIINLMLDPFKPTQ
jgi:small nuclear ribonucleoprotein (snRNP)-like protein